MKGLSIEEKAKAYDEALERAKVIYQGSYKPDTAATIAETLQNVFPELKESEDEKIRKELIDFFQDWHKIKPSRLSVNVSDILAWLEKQGEQKPAWSEEDKSQKELAETYLAVFDKHFPILPTLKGKQLADYKNFLNQCQQIFGLKYWGIYPTQARLFEKLSLLWATWGAEHLKGLGQTDGDTDNEKQEWSEEDRIKCNVCINLLESLIKEEYFDKKSDDAQVVSDLKFCCKDLVNWLKSIKDRVQPKPKQEWSEEDECYMSECIGAIATKDGWSFEEKRKTKHWLKSLKQRIGG